MSFAFDPTRPIYLQIMEEIKRRAVRGEIPPGGQVPSVRDLARQLGVNPNTVARAYLELEREGFVFTKRGQGTYITEDMARIDREREALAQASASRFIKEISSLGLSNEQITELIEKIKEEWNEH